MKPSQERMVFSMSILETKNLKKYYGTEPNITKALDGVTLTVEQGEFVAIVGTSGSGKSTLLNMMGGLDVPTSGNVKVKGKDLSGLNDEQLTIFADAISVLFSRTITLFPFSMYMKTLFCP